MATLGADETASARVTVEASGRGIEAAAREARYAVLDQMADHFGADTVLLGHTLDDQAETVLLGLARGSGGRSLAGMRRAFDRYRRPLLDVSRTDTVTACQVEGIEFWEDPHNADPAFTRVRVRHTGPAGARGRARARCRRDAGPHRRPAPRGHRAARRARRVGVRRGARRRGSGRAPGWRTEPAAIAHRVLRLAALDAGAPAAELFRVHVLGLAALLGPQPRPGEVQLPGQVTAVRDGDLLTFRPTAVEG